MVRIAEAYSQEQNLLHLLTYVRHLCKAHTRFEMSGTIALKSALAGAAVLAAAFASPAFAASCVQGPARMSDTALRSFSASPADLLTANMFGGLSLSNAIRQIVASDSDTLDAVMKLVASSNAAQSAAIASGLARAVQACATVDPAYADRIQKAVASLNNPSFLTAFTSSSDQIRTAAIGQGGQAGGQAVGGGSTSSDTTQRGGSNNSNSRVGSSLFNNSAFSFASGTSGLFVASPTN
jgi:hypothetical protein